MGKRNRKRDYTAGAILGQALTPFRMALLDILQQPAQAQTDLPVSQLADFLSSLAAALPDPRPFETELEKFGFFLQTGQMPDDCEPDIVRPENQLLWGAALLYVARNLNDGDQLNAVWGLDPPCEHVMQTPLWGAVTGTERAIFELSRHALAASEGLRRNDSLFSWSAPGSGFAVHLQDDERPRAGVDLAASLMMGVEHARAVMFREIGRAHFSVSYPPQQNALYQRIHALNEKKKQDGKLSKEDYKDLRLLSAEWQMRNMLYEQAEKNCLNRYVTIIGDTLNRDHAYSLNHTLITATSYGHAAAAARESGAGIPSGDAALDAMIEEFLDQQNVPDDLRESARGALRAMYDQRQEIQKGPAGTPSDIDPPDAYTGFINTVQAVGAAFHQKNALFENTQEGWRQMGIETAWIRRVPQNAPSPEDDENPPVPPVEENPLAHLLALCSGPGGLEHLRPELTDRWGGAEYYNHLVESMAARRHAIIETIWDEYLKCYAAEFLKEIENRIDQDIDQQQDNAQQSDDAGKDQRGDGQNGQSQDSQGGQQGQQGQQNQKDRKNQRGQPDQQGEEDQNQQGSQPAQQQGQQQAKQQGHKGRPQTGDPSEFGTDPNGGKVDVENNAEGQTQKMPDVETPPSSPQEQKPQPGQEGQQHGQQGQQGQPGQQGQQQQGQGQQGQQGQQQGKTLQQLLDQLKNKQQQTQAQDQDQKGQKAGQPGQDGQGRPGNGDPSEDGEPSEQAGSGGPEKTLEDIARMDWSDYPAVLAALRGVIEQVARILKTIRDRQLESEMRRSKRLEKLPEDNDIDRLRISAQRDFVIKAKTGQKIEDADLNRFEKDEKHQKPTTLDIVLLIDGSSSMDSRRGNSASPLEIATLCSAIIYEAAQKIDANVYIGMWGNKKPVMLARPGDSHETVAQNLIAARGGLNCGTDLEPSITTIVDELANQKGGSPYAGMTHIMVFSDGDIFDRAKAEAAINALLATSPYTTLDFAIVKTSGYGTSAMEAMADTIQSGNSMQRVGVVADGDVEKLPAYIIGLLLEKMQHNKSFVAVPRHKKTETYIRARQKIGMLPRPVIHDDDYEL